MGHLTAQDGPCHLNSPGFNLQNLGEQLCSDSYIAAVSYWEEPIAKPKFFATFGYIWYANYSSTIGYNYPEPPPTFGYNGGTIL